MTPEQPRFEWRLLSDATAAGLSVLIPLPLVDLAFEGFFRRRIPRTICRYRGVECDAETLRRLARGAGIFTASSCLAVPVAAAFYLLRRFSRKILYFLTIREAANQLVRYWTRAYLIDHMARSGHLDPGTDPQPATRSMEQALDETDTSGLGQLARHLVLGSRNVLGLLTRARRHGAEGELSAEHDFLRAHWTEISARLVTVATRYDRLCALPSTPQPPPPQPSRPKTGSERTT